MEYIEYRTFGSNEEFELKTKVLVILLFNHKSKFKAALFRLYSVCVIKRRVGRSSLSNSS